MGKGDSKKSSRRVILLGGLGVATLGAAILLIPRAIPQDYRPLNIVLVTADTLRADHLPAYGYQRVSTPSLDAMAASGVLFENAHTVVSRERLCHGGFHRCVRS